MFRCEITNKTTRPGEKMHRVVIEKREKVYTEWCREEGEWIELEIGRGWEIVKEIQVSDEGLRIYDEMVEAGTLPLFAASLKHKHKR